MSKKYPMIEYMKRGPFDDIDTPMEAVRYLAPYIPYGDIIWECAPGRNVLVEHLKDLGCKVAAEERDFFEWEPDEWDAIITNPPYSLKGEWLARCVELNKPFALLLPVTTLGAAKYQRSIQHCDILFLPKRIDFTGKGAPWFAVAWFTRGMLESRMQFILEDECQ